MATLGCYLSVVVDESFCFCTDRLLFDVLSFRIQLICQIPLMNVYVGVLWQLLRKKTTNLCGNFDRSINLLNHTLEPSKKSETQGLLPLRVRVMALHSNFRTGSAYFRLKFTNKRCIFLILFSVYCKIKNGSFFRRVRNQRAPITIRLACKPNRS